VYRQVSHNEVITVLVGNSSVAASMAPLVVTGDAWSDVRMRSYGHDASIIGDPGSFWMFYFPMGALLCKSVVLRSSCL
jgi:hypothetical protein